jgi:hypothetical protein
MEQLCDHEHVTEATKSTHTLHEASNLTTSKSCLPALMFNDVQRNIGMFCVFLYILFGSKCEYYAKFMDHKCIFDNPSTQSIHKSLTVPVCCRIVWAIVCNGRFFFSKVKLSQDLMPGMGWKDRPTSPLNLIMDKVMFAEQIIHPTFPVERELVMSSPLTSRGYNKQQGAMPCGGSPRAGDHPQPCGDKHQGDRKGNPYQQGAQYQQGRKITPMWTNPREA